ncbi:hypothetical protein RIF29_14219 [Crotalaria pallida]|uniref:Uncharacterized protein n=1 Tax=Crotalaria pallida TaxID=3830 RepID=A0AAN9FDF8_CROPI
MFVVPNLDGGSSEDPYVTPDKGRLGSGRLIGGIGGSTRDLRLRTLATYQRIGPKGGFRVRNRLSGVDNVLPQSKYFVLLYYMFVVPNLDGGPSEDPYVTPDKGRLGSGRLIGGIGGSTRDLRLRTLATYQRIGPKGGFRVRNRRSDSADGTAMDR